MAYFGKFEFTGLISNFCSVNAEGEIITIPRVFVYETVMTLVCRIFVYSVGAS